MTRSISFKLMAGVLVILLVPLAAIFVLTAKGIAELSEAGFERAASGELKQAANVVSAMFEDYKLSVAMLAAHPLSGRLEEMTTSHVATKEPTSAKPAAGDDYGREIDELFRIFRETHPAYKFVYAGNRSGAFVLNSADEKKTQPPGYDPRQRPWWKQALADPGKSFITRAYRSADGFPMVSACRAVLDPKRKDVIGVAAIDITLNTLTELIKDIRIGRTGYVILVQDDGVILSNPKAPEQNFKNIAEIGNSGLASLFKGTAEKGEATIGNAVYRASVFNSPSLNWKFIGLMEEGELMEPLDAAVGRLALIIAGSLLATGLAIWFLTRLLMLAPLATVSGFLADISQGRYGRLARLRSDEIGDIYEALDAMCVTLKANIGEIEARTAEAQEKAGACQLATEEAEVAKQQAETARAEGMLEAARQLEDVVGSVRRAVDDLGSHSHDIRKGTMVQRERIHATATAMEEMNATVLEVARNASSAALQGTDARDKASQGAQVVVRSMDAMRQTQQKAMSLRGSMSQLDSQAQAIGKIMTTIEDIADQTNLLALNAAIEAARAGEAGRGFAVVADEVRKLAEKTMLATKEVGDSIRSIQEVAGQNLRSVEDAVRELEHAAELAGASGSALGEIVSSTDASAQQIQSIATAAEEQSATSEEINRSIEDVNAIAVRTDEHVAASLTALGSLEEQAENLARLIGQLKSQSSGAEAPGLPRPAALGSASAGQPRAGRRPFSGALDS